MDFIVIDCDEEIIHEQETFETVCITFEIKEDITIAKGLDFTFVLVIKENKFTNLLRCFYLLAFREEKSAHETICEASETRLTRLMRCDIFRCKRLADDPRCLLFRVNRRANCMHTNCDCLP